MKNNKANFQGQKVRTPKDNSSGTQRGTRSKEMTESCYFIVVLIFVFIDIFEYTYANSVSCMDLLCIYVKCTIYALNLL